MGRILWTLATAAALAAMPARAEKPVEPNAALLTVKRVYVYQLTGGEAAEQMRDLLIAALQTSKLFTVTENQEKADTFLRGTASDETFKDEFRMTDSINTRASIGSGGSSNGRGASNSHADIGVGQNESTNISERKHEALASVRLVTKDGDVIWSATKESLGAKFRGASADVADKVMKQLTRDMERAKTPPVPAVLK